MMLAKTGTDKTTLATVATGKFEDLKTKTADQVKAAIQADLDKDLLHKTGTTELKTWGKIGALATGDFANLKGQKADAVAALIKADLEKRIR